VAVIETTTQGLLFDMDGVLISSIESANRCWRRWAIHYGVPDAENYQVPHGVPGRQIIRELLPDVDQDEALHVIEQMEIDDAGEIQVLPGVRELLAGLPPERWTVVTSCTRRLLEVRLRIAGLPMPPKLICADDVTNGKPNPEPYLMGAAALGFAPEDCIVVEDAVSGVESGVAAGCRVLALLSSTPHSKLVKATWIARSLAVVKVAVEADGLTLTIPLARKLKG
jgi:sugar-phosphatase